VINEVSRKESISKILRCPFKVNTWFGSNVKVLAMTAR
jgi:hypothetical protein